MSNILKNFLSAFGEPKPNPLYGKPLVYLIGAERAHAVPGSVVECSYTSDVIGAGDKIAYGNLFNEVYSDQTPAQRLALGPYLHDSDTAEEYGEGEIDPNGPGWEMNLVAQFNRAVALGFHYIELDNPDAYNYGAVAEAVTKAHSFGLAVIAKNPKITSGALAFMSHPNVAGVVVERGCGSPSDYASLRAQARRDGLLPVWFVFDGPTGAQQCAEQIQHGGYKGMGVTYSTGRGERGYNDSHSVLTPVV